MVMPAWPPTTGERGPSPQMKVLDIEGGDAEDLLGVEPSCTPQMRWGRWSSRGWR